MGSIAERSIRSLYNIKMDFENYYYNDGVILIKKENFFFFFNLILIDLKQNTIHYLCHWQWLEMDMVEVLWGTECVV